MSHGQLRQYSYESSALNVVPEADLTEPGFALVDRQPADRRVDRRDLPHARKAHSPVVAPPTRDPQPAGEVAPTRTASVAQAEHRTPAAPATTPPPQQVAPPPNAPAPHGSAPPTQAHDLRAVQRVEAAQALLGTPGLQERAFVAQVLRAAAQDVAVDAKQPYAAALWAKLDGQGVRVVSQEARPGDLVFFRDTADLNNNGKPDDGATLVGVVERVRGQHVVLIAQRAGKVRRLAVDPSRPLVIRDAAGDVVNTRLVRWPGSDQPWTTGQCLLGYARP